MKRKFSPVDPVYRIPNLAINAEALADRASIKLEQFMCDRAEWLRRREEYYLGWDDYLTPVRTGPWDGSSNVHLPLTEIQAQAMHARILQAFFFLDPWVYVDPQEELDFERIQKIELQMKYIVMRYANYNKGIYNAIDDWAWDLVTGGVGILSRDWRVEQRRAIIVVDNEDFKRQRVDMQAMLEGDIDAEEFSTKARDLIKQPYQEKEVIRTVFNGPIVRAEDPSFIFFAGDVADSTDLDLHTTVIKVCYFTREELIAFKESEFMDAEAIDEILEREPDQKGSTNHSTRLSRVTAAQDYMTGVRTQNSNVVIPQYEFLCVYDRTSLEVNDKKRKTSLADELVYYVHSTSKKLTRWTFLDRVSSTGKRPLHMAHLYRRPRRSIGRGMVETQGPLNDVADMLVNQSIDTGMLVNQPMFGYRGNATFDPQEIRVEPGLGIRMDDPNNDLRFFEWRVNPNWSQGIIGLVQSFSQQLTSLGPLSMGQVGSSVGPLRSNSGAQTLLGETGTNLDVIIKRAKIPFSEMLEGLYADTLDRMPDKIKISVTGAEGQPILNADGVPMMVEVTQEDLRARVHFGLYANSQNMNRGAQEAAAMKMAQFLLQPIAIQTGNVRPENVHEILMHVVRSMGTPRSYRFVSKPANPVAMPLQAELLMIMQGMKPPVVLNDPEHEMKITAMEELANSEKSQQEVQYGSVHPKALEILAATMAEHEKFLQVMQKPTNLPNVTGTNNPITGGGPQDIAAGGEPPMSEPDQSFGMSPEMAGA